LQHARLLGIILDRHTLGSGRHRGAVGAPFVASRLSPLSRFLSAVSDTYPIHSSAAGVAVRSGHHCTQPLHRYLGINASARASLYIYSTATDVDRFITGLKESIEFFS